MTSLLRTSKKHHRFDLDYSCLFDRLPTNTYPRLPVEQKRSVDLENLSDDEREPYSSLEKEFELISPLSDDDQQLLEKALQSPEADQEESY